MKLSLIGSVRKEQAAQGITGVTLEKAALYTGYLLMCNECAVVASNFRRQVNLSVAYSLLHYSAIKYRAALTRFTDIIIYVFYYAESHTHGMRSFSQTGINWLTSSSPCADCDTFRELGPGH